MGKSNEAITVTNNRSQRIMEPEKMEARSNGKDNSNINHGGQQEYY